MGNIFDMAQDEAEGLPLDDLSKLTMTYTSEGYEELLSDIADRGQTTPIQLRDGKILDGRHRHKVCMELGIAITCEELGSLPYDEALSVVISNAINKNTNSDASKIEAYLMCKAGGISNAKMPAKFSRLNSNYVSKIRFIEKCNPDYLQAFLKQNKVRLYNMEFNKIEDYGTINGLWRCLKGNQKLEGKVIEVIPEPVSSESNTTDLGAYFDNAQAESEYWELYNISKEAGIPMHPDTPLGKRIASLIKYKYA